MLTPEDIKAKKSKNEMISMITAYDFAFAKIAEAAGMPELTRFSWATASQTPCSVTRARVKSA